MAEYGKGGLYARGGVADYWVLNFVDGVLEVYREPRADADAAMAFGWRYTQRQPFGLAASVMPVAAPTARVDVWPLFP